jgi:PST family polysaccharide transporter
LLGGLVAFGLAASISAGARPDDPTAHTAVLIVAASLLFQAGGVVRYWFESQVAARHLILPENLALVIGAGVRIALILSKAPLSTFFWVQLLEAVLIAVFLPTAYSRVMRDLRRWRATFHRSMQLMRDAWPLAVSGGIAMIQARLDQVVLSRLAGDHELGYYSVALRVSESLVFFSAALQSSTFPILVEARRRSVELFRQKLMVFYRVMFLVAFLICVPVAVLAPWIVHLLFGSAYAPAGVLLSLMSGRIFLAFMGLARSVYLAIENMQRYATVTVAVGTLLNLVLNLWWIPLYGATGAVWASLVSFTVTTILVDLLFPSVRGNALDLVRAMFSPHRIASL